MKWLLVLLLLCSCKTPPKAKVGSTTATAPVDAGTAAHVTEATVNDGVVIPAETPVEIVREDATQTEPERWTFRFTPSKDTELRHNAKATAASTGTVDTSVAIANIKSKERQPLLWSAIASAGALLFFTWRVYPTGQMLSGIAAAVFFAAWKVSGLPDWFWMVGLAAVAVAIGLFLGYERRQKDHLEELSNAQPKPVPVPPPTGGPTNA